MWRKPYMLIFLSGALLIGGCSKNEAGNQATIREEQQPSASAALQDDFTKEFIPSAKEVEEGYYTFESGVGGYTMLYPMNALMDQTYYQYKSQDNEVIYFWEDRKAENYGYSVVGHFDDRGATEWIEGNLELLIGSTDLLTPQDFDKYTLEDNDIYFAEYQQNINEDENGFYLHFLSYIKSRTADKAIRLRYSSTCISTTEECQLDLAQERERAKKIFHSVRFTPSAKKDDI